MDKSNLMNAYFSNVSLLPLNNPTRVVTSDSVPESIDSLLCSEEYVLHLLETIIDISKSNDPDRISGWILKQQLQALLLQLPSCSTCVFQ